MPPAFRCNGFGWAKTAILAGFTGDGEDTRFSCENGERCYPALESGISLRGGQLPTIRCAGRECWRLYRVKGFGLPLRDGIDIVGGVRFAGYFVPHDIQRKSIVRKGPRSSPVEFTLDIVRRPQRETTVR